MTRTGNWKKFREALNGSKHDRLKQRHTFFASHLPDQKFFQFLQVLFSPLPYHSISKLLLPPLFVSSKILCGNIQQRFVLNLCEPRWEEVCLRKMVQMPLHQS